MNKQEVWDRHFLDMCLLLAHKSKDKSLGVGCVIVGPDHEIRSTGYNGLPRGINYLPERLERPEKYIWTEHAERNAIYNAARFGVPLKNCTAYIACTDLNRGGSGPCVDCARSFIQIGIIRVIEFKVKPIKHEPERAWTTSLEKSVEMLREAGIVLDYLDTVNPS